LRKNIGLSVAIPKKECEDKLCPFHGALSIRGKIFQGKVVRAKAPKMVVVERESSIFISKFKRYARSKNKIHAFKPSCIDLVEGNTVLAVECRPISKTVSFVVVEVRT